MNNDELQKLKKSELEIMLIEQWIGEWTHFTTSYKNLLDLGQYVYFSIYDWRKDKGLEPWARELLEDKQKIINYLENKWNSEEAPY